MFIKEIFNYVPIAKIAASNIRQYLPKPKWFCVDKEMLQKYQYELYQQLGSIPLNEFMCNHTHENYKCQIQLLHDHLIHSCMLAAERTIPFTKPDTKQQRNKHDDTPISLWQPFFTTSGFILNNIGIQLYSVLYFGTIIYQIPVILKVPS